MEAINKGNNIPKIDNIIDTPPITTPITIDTMAQVLALLLAICAPVKSSEAHFEFTCAA